MEMRPETHHVCSLCILNGRKNSRTILYTTVTLWLYDLRKRIHASWPPSNIKTYCLQSRSPELLENIEHKILPHGAGMLHSHKLQILRLCVFRETGRLWENWLITKIVFPALDETCPELFGGLLGHVTPGRGERVNTG